MGLWELAAGRGGCRQAGSGMNDRSEVAEVMAVGRRFESLMVRRKKELNRTG